MFIRTLKDTGISVIVIEHNMRFVMGLVDRIVASFSAARSPRAILAPFVKTTMAIAAYLGRKRHAEH